VKIKTIQANNMQTKLFDYSLPPEKIAQHPLEPRDSSKLLVIQKTKDKVQSGEFDEILFRDITSLLRPDDILVINDTRVMPARIKWVTQLRQNTKYKVQNEGTSHDELKTNNQGLTTKDVECLFLRNTSPDIWEIMCFPGERLKTGRTIILENWMTLEIVGETYAGRLVKVPVPHHEWLEVLQKYGEIPLPPYITEHLANSELYQTVYAENLGSTAAPTAGRHFTPDLLEKIQNMGVKIAHVTLHIGPGTFKPIYEDDVTQYQIHSEFVTIPAETLKLLKNRKGRVVAVGTTSMRSLESYAAGKLKWVWSLQFKVSSGDTAPTQNLKLETQNYSWDTNLYITPGYEFNIVDALVTNFHAPRTSLLVLVAAFMGLENMQAAYQYALEQNFRFLSFGDAMWVEKK
jgi:S-adenosylmethionine:tRNA ribosyltransferase-isomerase